MTQTPFTHLQHPHVSTQPQAFFPGQPTPQTAPQPTAPAQAASGFPQPQQPSAAPVHAQPFLPWQPYGAPTPSPTPSPTPAPAPVTAPAPAAAAVQTPTTAAAQTPAAAPAAPPTSSSPVGSQLQLGTPPQGLPQPLTEASLLDKSPEWIADHWKDVRPLLS